MIRSAFLYSAVTVLVVAACQGCATSTADEAASPTTNTDWPNCPPEFAQLADELIRQRARNGFWPESIDEIRDEPNIKTLSAGWLERVCYTGTSVGTLADGRRIMLVDDRVLDDGWVYTVTQSDARPPALPKIEITAVTWAELVAAAASQD